MSNRKGVRELSTADKYYFAGDFENALNHYIKAAQLGNSKAITQVGLMYYNGIGTEVNYEKAACWLDRSPLFFCVMLRRYTLWRKCISTVAASSKIIPERLIYILLRSAVAATSTRRFVWLKCMNMATEWTSTMNALLIITPRQHAAAM